MRCLTVAGLAVLLTTGCPGPPPRPADPADSWRRVVLEGGGGPGDAAGLVEAARLALFERGDAAHAERLLQRAVGGPPSIAANLLRTYLAWRRLDHAGTVDRAVATVDAAPESPEAEVAAWFLADATEHSPAAAQQLAPWLRRVASADTTGPELRALAGRLLAVVAALARDPGAYDAAVSGVGGLMTRVRTACPFGRFPAVDARRTLPPDRPGSLEDRYDAASGGWRPDVRTVTLHARDGWLECPSWPPRGAVVFHETHVRVPADVAARVEVTAPGWWRLEVDGRVVLEHDGLTRLRGRRGLAAVQLERGWHRLRLRVAAGEAAPRSRLRLTDAAGRAVAEEVLPLHPEVALAASYPSEEDAVALDAYLAATPSTPGAALERQAYVVLLRAGPPDADSARAVAAAGALVAEAPQSGEAAWLLAHALSLDPTLPDGHRRSQARALCQRTLEAMPRHVRAHSMLARLEQQEGRPRSALDWYDRLVDLAPADWEAHLRRFEVLQELGWDREAGEALSRAMSLQPNVETALAGAGFWSQQGAVGLRDKLLDTADRLAVALATALPAGRALARGDLAATAEGLAAQAAARPADAMPWRQLADLAVLRGDWDALKAALAGWEARAPGDPEHAEVHARAFALAGDPARARRELSQVLDQHPERLPARRLLEALGGPALAAPGPDGQAVVQEWRAAVRGDRTLAAWEKHPVVVLLDRRADHLGRGGAGYREEHRVLLLQSAEAVDELGEWRPPLGGVVLAVRTLDSDGSVLEPEVGHARAALSLSGLAAGDAVELHTLQPLLPDLPGGGFHDSFAMARQGRPIWRASLDVSVPAVGTLAVARLAGAPAPVEAVRAGRRVYSWSVSRVEAAETDALAAPDLEWVPNVTYSYDAGDADVVRQEAALDRLLRGAVPTAAIDAHAKAVTEGVDGVRPRAGALFRWVRDHVEDVGSVEPLSGDATHALHARRGDRALLLSALLTAAGIPHRVLLARPVTDALVDPAQPSADWYHTPVVAVDAGADGPWLLDVRSDEAPAGWLRDALQGAAALVVAPGPTRLERLEAPADPGWVMTGELHVGEAGSVRGQLTVRVEGGRTAALRRYLPTLPDARRRQVLEGIMAPLLRGLRIVALDTGDVEDRDAPLELALSVEAPGAFDRRSDGAWAASRVLGAVVSDLLGGVTSPVRYVADAGRRAPLLTTPLRERVTVAFRFDRGVEAGALPAPVGMAGPWGRLEQRWEVRGERLLLERTLDVGIHRVAGEERGAFERAVASLTQALEGEVVVRPAAPTGGAP